MPRHVASAKPADLRAGAWHDPHAAVCSCGWIGQIHPTEPAAHLDAVLHTAWHGEHYPDPPSGGRENQPPDAQ